MKINYRAPHYLENIPTRHPLKWLCPAAPTMFRPVVHCPSVCDPDSPASIGTTPTERISKRQQCTGCGTIAGQRIAKQINLKEGV